MRYPGRHLRRQAGAWAPYLIRTLEPWVPSSQCRTISPRQRDIAEQNGSSFPCLHKWVPLHWIEIHVIRVSFSFRILIKLYEAEIASCCSMQCLKLCLMGECFLLLCCSKFDTTLGFLWPTDHQIIRRSLQSNGKKINFEHAEHEWGWFLNRDILARTRTQTAR